MEQAEILLEQYKSVESEPKDDCTVNQNFFFESEKCSDCCDEKVHECNEDKSSHPENLDNNVDLTDLYFTVSYVRECIDMLSAGAAAGPDGVPATMLKGAKSTFSIMITNILRTSLDTGDIPDGLKLAHIIPLHKGGIRADPANFLPHHEDNGEGSQGLHGLLPGVPHTDGCQPAWLQEGSFNFVITSGTS